ncbi:hypothetical protein G6F31_015140 [Rhizopus arrhizus]|nr:hypothetical protein G6F31_015140 [Rhizopus arrhizus]
MPTLAIGTEHATRDAPLITMRDNATDLTGVIIADCGHFVTEECHEAFSEHLLAFLASAPLVLEDIRAATETGLRALQGGTEAVDAVTDHEARCQDGHPLRIRAYTPAGLAQHDALPAIVFAHGGGWFQCSLAVYDGPCRALANSSGCWLQANAGRLGLDPQRLAIGGDSAGGNLAAACCLLLRDLGLPQPPHQLLLYPALDAGMGSDSYREYANGFYLNAELMQRCWQAYLGDLDAPPALASPAHATDLQGLAPASVLSCEHDPLRDEAEQYARRLQAAGVGCTLERLSGMIHACLQLRGVAASTEGAVQRAGVLLRRALS